MKVFLALFAVLLALPFSHQLSLKLESDVDPCYLFPDGTEMRKPGTCVESIVCQNGKSTKGRTCTTSGQGWSLAASPKCAKVSDDYCSKTNCKKNGDTWVSDVKNCRDWVQCSNTTKVSDGTCPAGQVFNQKQQMCVYKTEPCGLSYDICNVAPQSKPFWDEDNCHKYFTCSSKQKIASNTCPTGTYYVPSSGQCIAKAQAGCYKHPYPENVCGTAKLPIRNRFVDDMATCRGYFYCADLKTTADTKPVWGQCPVDMFFDKTQEVCRHRTHVSCPEDRCDGREKGLELSETLGCQHYLVCEGGYTIAEKQCSDNKYFDAALEACVDAKTSYPVCAHKN